MSSPGNLDAFLSLGQEDKVHRRQQAIDTIRKECVRSGKTAVVAGHFMFWSQEEETGQPVYTQNDLDTFSHILYLDVPAGMIAEQCLNDTERSRVSTPVAHLHKWQKAEKAQLRCLCRQHGILFSPISPHPKLLNKVSTLLLDFRLHTEKRNLSYVEKRLDEALTIKRGRRETMLVMDADKTLSAEDTGALFWKKFSNSLQAGDGKCPLNILFSSPLGHSYTAFRQAALLYEEAADDQAFDALCEDVASEVTMHPEFVSLLHLAAKYQHVGAVVVTCGLRRVWEKVLKREGLSETVQVIRGGRIEDGFVITGAVKGALVARLREIHQIEPLSWLARSTLGAGSMDAALMNAIDNDSLQGHQVLLPSNASPRLDTIKLPLIQLTGHEFIESVLSRRSQQTGLEVIHATDTGAAKLLMTPMRDSKVSGLALRKVHRRVGWYLAIEYLTDVIGVEDYLIPHVQGHSVTGHQLAHGGKILIIALMRGGEPMALGVNDAFPEAMFLHANCPDDIQIDHLRGTNNVVLVDSVVNSGKTLVEFVQRIYNLQASVRIVVVSGVVNAGSVVEGSPIQSLARHARLSIVALRLSSNNFTGRGSTDTGNRLFNTTHRD